MYTGKILLANPINETYKNCAIFVVIDDEQKASGFIFNSPQKIGEFAVCLMDNLDENSKGKIQLNLEKFRKQVERELSPDADPGEKMNKLIDKFKVENDLDFPVLRIDVNYGGPIKIPGYYMIHNYPEFKTIHLQEGNEENEYDLGIPNNFDTGSSYDDEYNSEEESDSEKNLEIGKGIYFGYPQTLSAIQSAGKMEKNRFRVFSGVCVWENQELQNEIKAGLWMVLDADQSIVFNPPKFDFALKGNSCFLQQFKEKVKDENS